MHHATELPSTPKNHYRFAMIGTTSSGKTCLLAQMALAKNYSQRFTSSFVTTGCRLTQEEEMRKDQSRDLRQRYNFQIGEERLKAAQKDLQAYQLPAQRRTIPYGQWSRFACRMPKSAEIFSSGRKITRASFWP